jgi:aspartyl/asparaginyl beta-hydroxylase (cupin superfamily)
MGDEDAVDQILNRQPQDISALVQKGNFRTRAGDHRAASAFYNAALKAAAAAGQLPMSLKPAIEQAQAALAGASARYEHYLESELADAGFSRGNRPPRFEESLDVMFGKREADLKLQRPTLYFFPGLPQRRYYEPSEFPWAARVEAAAGTILSELQHFQQRRGERFSPYMVSDPSRPRSEFHGLIDNPQWSTFHIWENGGPVEDVADAFPLTLKALDQVDLPHITVRAPSILFSRLSAGARIPPHHGMLNARLICHLPLIVPPGCGFRVGGETRQWRPGELLIFDDTVEHEAWNDATSDRIILIFDIWRPELDESERAAIVKMFEAVDSYS